MKLDWKRPQFNEGSRKMIALEIDSTDGFFKAWND
jgi:hypothetical protein